MAHSRCSSCEMGGVQVINLKKQQLVFMKYGVTVSAQSRGKMETTAEA